MRHPMTYLVHVVLAVSLGISSPLLNQPLAVSLGETAGAAPEAIASATPAGSYQRHNHPRRQRGDKPGHQPRADHGKHDSGKHKKQNHQRNKGNGHVSKKSFLGNTLCGLLEQAPPIVGRGCSHGPDPAPPGFDIHIPVPPLPLLATRRVTAAMACDSDGQSGFRVQVLYVRGADVASRYNEFLPSLQRWASDANDIFQASAAETGGSRGLRFVQDATCQPSVTEVVISPSHTANFWDTVADLQGQGFTRQDRIYLLFTDATNFCGYGSLWADDQPGGANANNQGPSYARVDSGCWSGALAAHELMHNLGGVQNSSPHASGGFHCIDDYDVMCYSDSPNYPAMQTVCSAEFHEARFDCGHDDYFSTNPAAGSYLQTHWNTANNRFLIGALDLPGNAPATPTPPQLSVETKKHKGSAATVTVSASVDASAGVQTVRFGVCTGASCTWDAARSIGETSAAPYHVQWKPPKSGTFSFLAQAAYTDGSTAVSGSLTISQKAKKSKPKGRH